MVNAMQVEGVLYIRLFCIIPLSVLVVLLLHKVGYFQSGACSAVLWVHVHHIV